VPIPLSLEEADDEMRSHIRPDILDEIIPSFPSRIRLHNPRLFESMLANIIYLQEQEQELGSLLVKAAFLQLFHQLLFEINFTTSQHHDPKQDYAIRIKLYIENNLHRAITLDELSEGVNLSKSYLLDIYKSIYHISPIKHHQIMRINKARYMLRYTQQNVSEIGAALGFQRIHDFSRTFKNIEGVSPTVFREQSANHTIRTKPHIRTE
jgi:AraC-like DNA-binding protein